MREKWAEEGEQGLMISQNGDRRQKMVKDRERIKVWLEKVNRGVRRQKKEKRCALEDERDWYR